MKLVYIAGPFRAADAWEVHCNVHRAELASREIAGMGAMPVAPHSIGAHMDGTETAEFWLSGTLELMRRCDAVLVLSGYEHSAGTLGEIQEAKRLGLPLFLPHQHGPAFTSLFVWLQDNAAVHTTPVLPLSDEAPETKRCQYCGQGFAVLRAGHIFCGEKCREGALIAAQVEALSQPSLKDKALHGANCRNCGGFFIPSEPGHVFCASDCEDDFARQQTKEAVPVAIPPEATGKTWADAEIAHHRGLADRPEPEQLAAAQWAEVNSQGSDYPDGAVSGQKEITLKRTFNFANGSVVVTLPKISEPA